MTSNTDQRYLKNRPGYTPKTGKVDSPKIDNLVKEFILPTGISSNPPAFMPTTSLSTVISLPDEQVWLDAFSAILTSTPAVGNSVVEGAATRADYALNQFKLRFRK